MWRHGHRLSRWEKKQADRNEVLDLMVYNTAAAQYLGLHKLTDTHWDKLSAALNPNQISLFDVIEPVPVPREHEIQAKQAASQDAASASSYQIKSIQPVPMHRMNAGRISLGGLRRHA